MTISCDVQTESMERPTNIQTTTNDTAIALPKRTVSTAGGGNTPSGSKRSFTSERLSAALCHYILFVIAPDKIEAIICEIDYISCWVQHSRFLPPSS